MSKVNEGLRLVALAGALLFGGVQAAQGGVPFRKADCPPNNSNWCATSRGGLANCIACCNGATNSVCSFFDEDSPTPPFSQGCICGG